MNKKEPTSPHRDIMYYEYPPKDSHNMIFGRPRMSTSDRAKIFAPFAALKGFEESISEAGEQHIVSYDEN